MKWFSPGLGIAFALTSKTVPVSALLKSISDPQHPSVAPRETAGVRIPGSFEKSEEKGKVRCEQTPPLLFDRQYLLWYIAAEIARSFPPYSPNSPFKSHIEVGNMWPWSKHWATKQGCCIQLSNHFPITSGRFHLSVLKLLVNNLGVKLPFFCPYSALSTEVMSCCWHWNYFCVCAEHSRGFACPPGFHYNSDYSKGNFKRGENICFQAGSVTCLLSLSTGCTRKESAFEIKLGLGDSWSWSLTPGVVMCI